MTEPIRWCEINDCPVTHCYAKWESTESGVTLHGQQAHAECLMVESRDGDGRLLGLLAADPCPREIRSFERNAFDERYEVERWNPCPSCGGSGHTLRAPVFTGSILNAEGERVAVLPVEQP